MFHRLLGYRLLIWLMVLVTMVNALAFAVAGLVKTVKGIWLLRLGEFDREHRPGIMLIESLEMFVVALIFILFAMGIAVLFLPEQDRELVKHRLPAWARIAHLSDLKNLLWDGVLTSLLIASVAYMSRHAEPYGWDLLILPVIILILAGAGWILRKSH